MTGHAPQPPSPQPLDADGHLWSWDGHTLDLRSTPGQIPGLVRVALLAHRDAESEQDTDMADFLAWVVTDHPPWRGGCPACATVAECPVQRNAYPAATSWLVDRSQRQLNARTGENHHAK